jgi:Fe-S-cluster containining protein
MEITIDFAAVRSVAAEESQLTQHDIAALGPLPAYQRSLLRHDQRLADAADAHTLACKSGCSWCCHFSVDVRPVEAFNILDFLHSNFTAAQIAALRVEIEANAQLLSQLDELQRMQQNLPCPFLVEHRCSIYAARPQTCRNYHATDAAGCQQSFEQPDNFDIAPEYAPLVYQLGGAHVEAFSRAMAAAGYDVTAFELNTALAAALNDPAARQRFDARLPSFVGLDGTDVPYELTGMDQD